MGYIIDILQFWGRGGGIILNLYGSYLSLGQKVINQYVISKLFFRESLMFFKEIKFNRNRKFIVICYLMKLLDILRGSKIVIYNQENIYLEILRNEIISR